MSGAITDLLMADHARIGALLARAHRGDAVAYEELRGALLRHIGLEEKILIRAIRERTGRAPAVTGQLRLDHAALVAMLVPPPSAELLDRLRSLLAVHDPLEEGRDGLYAVADSVLADQPDVLERLKSAATPPLAAHFSGERAYAAIDALVARAEAGRSA